MFETGRPFVHLNVRSFFSMKDGAFPPEDLAIRAAELGMTAVALTDRDGLYGAPRFADACRHTGVRPIHGATLTLRTRRLGDRSVVFLAKDARGYANLCRLITTAHMTGERGDPSLTTSQVCERADGLIALLGPASEPGTLAVHGRLDAATTALRPWREAFGDDLFVEVVDHGDGSPQARQMGRLADDSAVRGVATNAVRYL